MVRVIVFVIFCTFSIQSHACFIRECIHWLFGHSNANRNNIPNRQPLPPAEAQNNNLAVESLEEGQNNNQAPALSLAEEETAASSSSHRQTRIIMKECEICYLEQKEFCTFQCNHEMCLNCLERWDNSDISKRSSLTCPWCREDPDSSCEVLTLHRLASSGSDRDISEFLQESPRAINDTDLNGCNALFYATSARNYDAMRALIELGASIDNTNEQGNTPLHIAVMQRDLEAISIILANNGANTIQEANNQEHTPLFIAITRECHEIVKLLVEEIYNKILIFDQQSLQYIEENFETLPNEIIEAVFFDNYNMTINGNTALNNAILHNHPRVSLFLIERGANINIMSNNGYSSLQLARQNNLTDVVIRLEEVSRRQQISQIATRLVAEVARISIRSTIRRISHSNNRNRAAIINLPGQIQSSEAQAISSLAHLPLLGVEKN